MKSIHASELVGKRIWRDFTAHFKSQTTEGSYEADIDEIMEYFQRDFLGITENEVREYFAVLENRVKRGELMPGTMAKKFRELHSFAEYICENRERYCVGAGYQDYYYPYLKLVAKQEKYVRSVPVEHIDQLLQAAQDDMMAYCILVLLYRMGLSSTQIIELKPEDFGAYDNGVYVKITGREDACYVPEDVTDILEQYLNVRTDHSYLFYNKRGNQLNTMYISRMMKTYTEKAGIPSYSAQSLRNTCGVTMYAYGAESGQVANQLGTTKIQIKRYKNESYREKMLKDANNLVKLRVIPPDL